MVILNPKPSTLKRVVIDPESHRTADEMHCAGGLHPGQTLAVFLQQSRVEQYTGIQGNGAEMET